ncbi:hypothetical protein [Corynebacterium sp.]|uniref:hypothetical protein n=1 Tax=Corynebacterium sp. TaxID=1720 RepID=UPI0026DFFDD8|nr:hypothetical protein [Corynebacterium sp.]MDO5512833.1 hypothetical protein [Corynebacterium sp.]
MRLSTTGRYLIAIAIVAWIGVLALLIGMRAGTGAETRFATSGALERGVASAEANGQAIAGLVPQDLYGEEWVAVAVICPFESEEGISRHYDVDASELNLGSSGVPEDTNYLLLRSADGGHAFDRIDRSDIDLCSVQLGQYIDARAMLPLGANEHGGWELLN